MSISCKNLLDADTFSKSDPFVVVQEYKDGKWTELFRTEVISNNLNPVFIKSAYLLYKFEQIQKLRFSVYDCDESPTENLRLEKQDFIGYAETTLANIINNPQCSVTINLINNNKPKVYVGTIIVIFMLFQINGEELSENNSLLDLGYHLESKRK